MASDSFGRSDTCRTKALSVAFRPPRVGIGVAVLVRVGGAAVSFAAVPPA